MRLVLAAILTFALSACSDAGKAATSEDANAPSPAEKKDPSEIIIPVSAQAGIIETHPAELSSQPDLLRVPGNLALTDKNSWRVGVVASGRVEKVYVNLGDAVTQGQVLARVHSHEVHDTRAEYAIARSDLAHAKTLVETANRNLQRAQRLLDLKAGSAVDVERARQEATNAEAEVRDQEITLEKERIHLEEGLGVSAEGGGGEDADLIPVRAAGTGYIIKKDVSVGKVVDPEDDVFVISDLKKLWMIASISEESIARIQVGQHATVTVNGFANQNFSGRVSSLGEEFDPVIRVMRIRIDIDNPGMRLRPEMLATAQIEVGNAKPQLAITAEAIQQVNEQDVVLIRKSDDHFEVRPVRVSEPANGRVVVFEGLKAGEAVVTKGSFIVKSELLKASLAEE
jgi:membrane fusion protein, heavy metal efflux system